MKTETLNRVAPATKPLSFEERLALAALAVDARIQNHQVNLDDIIRAPGHINPPPTPCPYTTPVAVTLHNARIRLETAGWCAGALRDQDGARCLIGAIQAAAPTGGVADDACRVLLDAIQRDFPGAESIPAWNDSRHGPRQPLLYLDRAATLAHARSL
jgi:hypothetical protein